MGPSVDQPTILVLDDEKNIRKSIEIALEQEGMQVLGAHDVSSALRADRRYRGLFETANRGTLFLDEVADLALAGNSIQPVDSPDRRIDGLGAGCDALCGDFAEQAVQ